MEVSFSVHIKFQHKDSYRFSSVHIITMLAPVNSHHQHVSGANVLHSVSVSHGLLEIS